MLSALIINIMYAKAIGVTMGIMAREVGSDMWIASVVSFAKGVLIMLLTVVLIRRVQGKDIVDGANLIFGKLGEKLVAFIVFVFFVMTFGVVMVTFVYHLKDYFLPDTPTIYFVVVAMIVGIYGCYAGLEVMGRMALVGVFSILTLNILLMFGSIHSIDINNLLPIMDNPFLKILWASRQNDTDWAMATMMAAMILPHVVESKQWSRSASAGIVVGAITVVMWPLLEASVLSAPVTADYIVACMQMARSAHIGRFVHRYEMLMIAFFAISALIQVMICIFCASFAASKLIGLKDYRSLLIPVSVIMGAFSYWIVLDHIRAIRYTADWWPKMGLPIAIGLPLIMLLGSYIMRSRLGRFK